MKKKDLIIASGAALTAVIAISGIIFVSSASEKGFGPKMRSGVAGEEWAAKMEEKKADFEAKREVMQAIFEAGDYSAWLEQAPENCPMKDKITEENFARFSEAHNMMSDGRKILKDEFGMEKFGHKTRGKGREMKKGGNCPFAK